MRDILHGLKYVDRLLDQTFELGRQTSDPDLEAGDTPLIWVTLSSGSLYKDMKEGRFCSMPTCSCLDTSSIPSLALEPNSPGFQHIY